MSRLDRPRPPGRQERCARCGHEVSVHALTPHYPDGARLVLELEPVIAWVSPAEGRAEHVARAWPIHRCRDPRGPVIVPDPVRTFAREILELAGED